MRVRMLCGMAGDDFNLAVGDEHNFDDRTSIRLIEAGSAVPVPAKAERAVRRVPERRSK